MVKQMPDNNPLTIVEKRIRNFSLLNTFIFVAFIVDINFSKLSLFGVKTESIGKPERVVWVIIVYYLFSLYKYFQTIIGDEWITIDTSIKDQWRRYIMKFIQKNENENDINHIASPMSFSATNYKFRIPGKLRTLTEEEGDGNKNFPIKLVTNRYFFLKLV